MRAYAAVAMRAWAAPRNELKRGTGSVATVVPGGKGDAQRALAASRSPADARRENSAREGCEAICARYARCPPDVPSATTSISELPHSNGSTPIGFSSPTSGSHGSVTRREGSRSPGGTGSSAPTCARMWRSWPASCGSTDGSTATT